MLLLSILLICGCGGEEFETRHSMMVYVGAEFNNLGKALNKEDPNLAKTSFANINTYIRSEKYLAWRNSLETDSQAPYRDMEKRIFNIGEAIDGGIGPMRMAYKHARVSCMKCHFQLRTDKRTVLNQEVTPLKNK